MWDKFFLSQKLVNDSSYSILKHIKNLGMYYFLFFLTIFCMGRIGKKSSKKKLNNTSPDFLYVIKQYSNYHSPAFGKEKHCPTLSFFMIYIGPVNLRTKFGAQYRENVNRYDQNFFFEKFHVPIYLIDSHKIILISFFFEQENQENTLLCCENDDFIKFANFPSMP